MVNPSFLLYDRFMKIEAVFFDIDGTLVDLYTRKIPSSTIKALNELREKGIKLFICSGRNPDYRIQLNKEIPFMFDGYIFMNGQWIADKDGKCLYAKAFDKVTKEKLYEHFKKHPEIFFTVYSDKGRYTNSAKTNNPFIKPNPRDISNILTEEVYQLSAFETAEEDKLVEEIEGCKCARWGIGTDIIPSAGGKDSGVKEVLKIFDIDKENTMAFGDGENDIAMFKAVNLSVAMNGANDVVKKVATEITDNCIDDGIYNALKRNGVI